MGEGEATPKGDREKDDAEVLERLRHTAYHGEVKTGRTVLTAEQAHQVLDFGLRLGKELTLSGFDTQAVESSVIAATTSLGLTHLEVDIAAQTIHLQYTPRRGAPVSMMRVTRGADTRNLQRMAALYRLVERIVDGGLDVRRAAEALRRVQAAEPRWPWWVRVAGGGVLAASVTLQVGGSLWAALAAFAVMAATDGTGRLLTRIALPYFFVMAAQAALIVVIGVVLLDTGHLFPYGTAVVAANLVVLLPIVPLVALPQDAITGFSLMAATRAVNVTLAFAGLITGVAVAVSLIEEAGSTLWTVDIDHSTLPFALGLLVSTVGAVGNCVSMGGTRRLLPAALAAGLLAGGVNMLMSRLFDLAALSVLCAAAVLGLLAVVCGPRLRMPPEAFIVPGVTGALLPSLQVYQSLSQLTAGRQGAMNAVLTALVATAAIGVGLVLGKVLGNNLVQCATRLVPRQRKSART
ncbi:threonine/serine exporter ThrE family protein [Streptomyces sp. NPDC087440]|uniref:threonine/serine ThrE exporter family protein n=1 Tax=Streptomyces sp. NPDC087440 TaxID=3365790 RepID=UPI00381AEB03